MDAPEDPLRLRWILAVSGTACAAVGCWLTFGSEDSRLWLADSAVGVAFVVTSVLAAARTASTAVLLFAIAVTWWLGALWQPALFWHRGILILMLFAFPGVGPRSRVALGAVVAGCAVSLWAGVWSVAPIAFLLAAALAAAWVVDARVAPTRAPRVSTAAMWAFAATIAAISGAWMLVPDGSTRLPAILLYDVVMIAIAVALATRVAPRDATKVADLVVELGERGSGDLQRGLRRALGDTTLVVGYWDRQTETYRTQTGAPLSLDGGGRVTEVLYRDEPFAVLLHDAALDDPVLSDAVRWATLKTAENADLRGRLLEAIAQVEASRERLARADEDERRMLRADLEAQVGSPLRALARAWESGAASTDARARLADALADLDRAAAGLYGGDPDAGILPALQGIADRAAIPTTFSHDDVGAVDGEAARVLRAVAAEALTNAAKHAHATTAHLTLARDSGALLLTVSDDGRGGVSPDATTRAGTGLAGLAARLAAIGGSLTIECPAGGGTTVAARIPGA